jgi:putative DNA methylase
MTKPIRKKLIEVALPLEAINIASAREKSIRHGHPSTLHLWWARRPLATARAVIFAQMVDDPSSWPDRFPSKTDQDRERQRLFRLIEELVKWENTTNETVLEAARAEIRRSCTPPQPPDTDDFDTIIIEEALKFNGYKEIGADEAPEIGWRVANEYEATGKWNGTIDELRCALFWQNRLGHNQDFTVSREAIKELYREIRRRWNEVEPDIPAFHDPFAGGGALPLEAQRLGLEAYASDLNPVAVLINKAMIEIPPKFANRPPVNPESRRNRGLATWKGAQGLAEDVRYYGKWMRDEAEKRIGHLYPKVKVTADMVVERPDLKQYLGKELTVIAWIWARTVKSPNPAFRDIDVPLASTFMLSTKPGKEAYVEPVIENGNYRFTVKTGKPKDAEGAKNGTKLARGANFRCIMSDSVIGDPYIKAESMAGRMSVRLMAIVAEGDQGRIYLSPIANQTAIANQAKPLWKPDTEMNRATSNLVSGRGYGFFTWADLFTPRQLVALTTFSDLVVEARERVQSDAIAHGLIDDGKGLNDGGNGAKAYADAVATYLGFAVDKVADRSSSICGWDISRDSIRNTFGRQAIPMTWDFAEANIFSESTGNLSQAVEWVTKVLNGMPNTESGHAYQNNASAQLISEHKLVSTDPPYYDNIGYADLSDFFYVWLRKSLRSIYPDLFATIAVPKAEELVATPYRHGGKASAETFFLSGMTHAMHRIAEQSHPAFPVTIYYAFKQSETTGDGGEASTGWETFLQAVIQAGFALTGTWPMRTELSNRMIGSGTNALASSIVLVCRKREPSAATATRREFLTALERELAHAIADLQRGNIAPVDLQQAAIGPGMAIFTRYAQVLDAEGKPLSVRDALTMINQALDEVLTEQEGDFDSDTRWALTWFEQFGFAEGDYGVAETLSKAKNTSVQGIVEAGIAASGKGKVRLLRPDELPTNWTPEEDKRLTVWDMVHHLIRVLDQGESTAAALLAKLGSNAEIARELAYRLYSISDRTKRSQDAQRYNALVQSWPEIVAIAAQLPHTAGEPQLDFEGMN